MGLQRVRTRAPQALSPEQDKVERLTARIPELALPKAPALNEGELLKLAVAPHQWQLHAHVVQSLNAFVKADERSCAR